MAGTGHPSSRREWMLNKAVKRVQWPEGDHSFAPDEIGTMNRVRSLVRIAERIRYTTNKALTKFT